MVWGNGTVKAGGKMLEVACFGPSPSEAATIVLLHEGLGSVAMWKDFPQALSDATGMGVCAYSRAGHGQSEVADLPRAVDYMTTEAVDVLPDVLDAIGFERGVLMGHSDGATIAAIYAGTVSDMRVRATILMAPHFFTEPMGLAAIAQAKQTFQSTDLPQRLGKYHKDAEHTFKGWNDAWLNPDFEAWDVGDVIDHFRVPTFAIQGRNDEYGTLAQIEEIETRAYAPVDTLILEGCGHSPHIDQRAAVLAGIAEFTTRLERIEAAEVIAA